MLLDDLPTKFIKISWLSSRQPIVEKGNELLLGHLTYNKGEKGNKLHNIHCQKQP